MITVDYFADFFQALHGYSPFAWQQRLVEHIAVGGRWPAAIGAPTGAGKTSVIDVHLFVNALELPHRAPRTLALTVDRRALVDDHWEHAVQVRDSLTQARSGVLKEVADRLRELGTLPDGEPVRVHRLRGGLDRDNSWRDDPAACKVLCATPDMWGSRILFRGYGTSRLARPVEAGLLAYDSVVVIDEAHLNRQLVKTARDIAWHESRSASLGSARPIQVVETTATLAGEAEEQVGVEESDLHVDPELKRRMRANKTVSTRLAGNTEKARADALLAACQQVDEQVPSGTIGCIANTVAVAIKVYEDLKSQVARASSAAEAEESVKLLVGRMRPYDTRRLQEEHPGLFSHEGDPKVRFLVATQTIEVGIDMDLDGLVTEIAPGSALAQRFGRLNRRGAKSVAPSIVVLQENPGGIGPYRAEDLAAAAVWINALESDDASISPWAIRSVPPPAESPRRTLYQGLSLPDVEYFSNTSTDLWGSDPRREGPDDLTLWLSDALDATSEAFVAVRELPNDPIVAALLLREIPPSPDELFRISVARARQIGDKFGSSEDDVVGNDPWGRQAVFVFKPAAGTASPWGEQRVAPGDVLVVGPEVKCFTGQTADADGEAERDVSDVSFNPSSRDTSPAHANRKDGVIWVHAEAAPRDQNEVHETRSVARGVIARAVRTIAETGRLTRSERAELAEQLVSVPGSEPLVQLLRHERVSAIDLAAHRSEATGAGYLVARDSQRDRWGATAQTWTPARKVLLSDHGRAVGGRSRDLAMKCGLDAPYETALEQAGLLHDHGKMDDRFQTVLCDGEGDETGPLAKSGSRSQVVRRQRLLASGLPSGWRHEQLSAVHAWLAEPEHRELVVRLVGTSHGHGRGVFRDGSAELLQVGERDDLFEAASLLFDDGHWEHIVEKTNLAQGAWGIAYLEALLRAADTSVSGEGR